AYALLTQVRPKPVDKLVEGLYDGFFRSRRKGLSTREEESIDDLVQKCSEEGGYRLVVRDETGNSSLVMGSQMPAADIPAGGVMDQPLDAYLRSEGVSRRFAMLTYNTLRRCSPVSASYAIRLASRPLHGLEPGYAYSGVLTLGGAFAFISTEGLDVVQRGRGVGLKVIDALLTYVLNNAKVKELARS
ncbi:hypothetical protein HYV85_03115, partial [Candidatus Woesearchaeota archaeon]|nr:hypothetical protein [Candidatus Woesearchaeota archaeon]